MPPTKNASTHLHRDAATGWLVGDGEDPSLFLQPAVLIESGAQPETMVALTQEAAARVLDQVVNHWPVCERARRHWHQRLASRVDAAIRIASALSARGLCTSNPLDRVPRDPASLALACIRLARDTASRLEVPTREVEITIGGRRPDGGSLYPSHIELKTRLSELGTGARGAIQGLYLHGSVALGETTGFSDLDGAVLLAPAAEQDPGALARVARSITASAQLLLARDALQHHGWLVFAPFLLEAYPEDMLPLESLREGIVLFGQDRLVVRPLRCSIAARRRLWSMVQVFRTLRNAGAVTRPHSPHDDKMLLSQFMLLPALFAQATGRYVSKRSSFSLVRGEHPDLPWDIIDAASALRMSWTQPRFGGLWVRLARTTGPWEAQALWRRVSPGNRKAVQVCRVPDPWIDRMAEFAEMLLAIAENGSEQAADI
jgi:hypothetical protein